MLCHMRIQFSTMENNELHMLYGRVVFFSNGLGYTAA